MPNNHIDFGVDLIPNSTTKQYALGSSTKKWKIYGEAAAADILETVSGLIAQVYGDNTHYDDDTASSIYTLKIPKITITAQGTISAATDQSVVPAIEVVHFL